MIKHNFFSFKFYSRGTKDSEPKTTKGLSIQVDSLRHYRSEQHEFSYYEMTLTKLGVRWYFIVPDNHEAENIRTIIETLDLQLIMTMSEIAQTHEPGVVRLPALAINSTIDLIQHDRDNTESGIELKSKMIDGPMHIEHVLQTTVFNISESVGDGRRLDREANTEVITIDKPFVTIVIDTKTKIPILSGVVFDV